MEVIGNLFFIAILGAIGYFSVQFKKKKDKREADLKRAYQMALISLGKENSSNNRVAALNAGRSYMNFMRDRYKNSNRTIFDEVQLQNDIIAHGGS